MKYYTNNEETIEACLRLFSILVGLVGGYFLAKEKKEACKRYYNTKENVQNSINEKEKEIRDYLKKKKHAYNYYTLVDLHYKSIQVANNAYKWFKDSDDICKECNNQIKYTKNKIDELQKQVDSLREDKNFKDTKELISTLKVLREHKQKLYNKKENLYARKSTYLDKVRCINKYTHNLKELIRTECGSTGREWYTHLQERKRSKINRALFFK